MNLFAEQKEKSNYETPEHYKKTIHKLLYSEGLKLDAALRKVFELFWNFDKGITLASIKKLSEIATKKMGKGYGLTTIKTGLKMAQEYGLIKIENRHSDKTGYRGCAWKVVAEAEIIEAFVQARISTLVEENFHGSTSDLEIDLKNDLEIDLEIDLRKKAETLTESKDEVAKSGLHKTQLNKIKQNKLKDKDTIYPPEKAKGDRINKLPEVSLDLKDFLKRWSKFNKGYWEPEELEKASRYIQKGINKAKGQVDFKNPKHTLAIQRAVGIFRDKCEGNLEGNHYWNTLSVYIQNALKSAFGINENTKPTKKPIRTEMLPENWKDPDDYYKGMMEPKPLSDEDQKAVDEELERMRLEQKQRKQQELEALRNSSPINDTDQSITNQDLCKSIVDDMRKPTPKAPLPIGAITITSSGNESIQTI